MRRSIIIAGLATATVAAGALVNVALRPHPYASEAPALAPNTVAVAPGLDRAPRAAAPANNSAAGGGKSSASVAMALPAPAPASTGSTTAPPQPLGTPQGQQIERDVSASYTVPSGPAGTFQSDMNALVARAVGMGGLMVSSQTEPDAQGDLVSGTVTVEVPAAHLADLINGMPSGYVATAINYSSVDHTSQYTDLNAELAAAHAHHDVLLKLLGGATNLSDITSLDQQIADVQTQIDTLQGQLDQVNNAVDYSLAAITLTEKGSTAPAPQSASSPSFFQPLLDATGTGLGNARTVLAAIITSALSGLPLLLIGLALYATRRRWMGLFHAPVAARPLTPAAASEAD